MELPQVSDGHGANMLNSQKEWILHESDNERVLEKLQLFLNSQKEWILQETVPMNTAWYKNDFLTVN
jgi:hypothetical protein